jgi:hypothetical protein
MSYLRTFAPWIIYAVVPDKYWMWAALIALVMSIVVIVRQTRADQNWDALLIEYGSGIFFAALTIWAFADPNTALHPYAPAISNAVLALIAGSSMALGKPFTLGIAKQTTPREFWEEPVFIRTNWVITSVWATSFLIGCILMAILAHDSTPRIIVQVLAFAIPVAFTISYAARVQARVRALGEPAA